MFCIIKDFHNYNPESVVKDIEKAKKSMPYRFRLYDGDGILYFEGLSNDNDSLIAFNPLDWGSIYGCTSIKYFNEDLKKWEEL